MKKFFIISLGGSLIYLKYRNFYQLNSDFLKKFKDFIVKFLKRNFNFVIVVGGGILAKDYINQTKFLNEKIKNFELDNLGIKITEINALLFKNIFNEFSYYRILNNPKNKIEFLDFKNKVLFIYGFQPGHSTDYVSVLWAKKFKLDNVINLTDLDYVYDKNPKKFKNAKKIKKMLLTDYYKKIANLDWQPKLSLPFDPLAAKLAYKNKIKIFILNGNKLKNLENFLLNRNFLGTELYY